MFIYNDLTVMVKTFLRPEMVERFLESIGEYQNNHKVRFAEVIIGDDSDDEAIIENEKVINTIKVKYPQLNINYQKYEFYIGCSEGRNRMIDSIKTKYFLYCDDDYIFDNDCDFSEAIDLLECNGVDLISGWWKNYKDLRSEYHVINFLGYFLIREDAVTCMIYNNFTPHFCYADYHTNFYIAKTDKIKQIKWDPELKTEEHPEFFFRAYQQGLKMAFTNQLFVKHNHTKSERYEQFRNINRGGKNYLYLRVKKAGVKKWIAYYVNDDAIRKWTIDYDNKINYQRNYYISLESKEKARINSLLLPIYNKRVLINRITPEFEHFFFGYYDIQAMNDDESEHLALGVPFIDRLPNRNDKADICVIKEDGSVKRLDETYAWNFQQGAFLQYRPRHSDQVVYNIFDQKDNKYNAVVYDLQTNDKRTLPLPVANISPNGDKALSINFSRLHDYRPGYGYCNIKDPHYNDIKPKDDGVFLLDLESGKFELIISYKELWELFAKGTKNEKDKLIINHVCFNTDGTRFLMFLRFFSKTAPWPTLTITSDLHGENVFKIFGFGSHYHWKDNHKLVISGANIHNKSDMKFVTLYDVEDITGEYKAIDESFFKGDGHCSYSPDRRYMLYDSYPSKQFPYRKLQIYDLEKRKGITLAYLYSNPELCDNIKDCRCDLHPLWSPNGNFITFDSIHEGFRGIYRIDARKAINEIYKDTELLSEAEIKEIVAPVSEEGSKSKGKPKSKILHIKKMLIRHFPFLRRIKYMLVTEKSYQNFTEQPRKARLTLKNRIMAIYKRILLKISPSFRKLSTMEKMFDKRLNGLEKHMINKLDDIEDKTVAIQKIAEFIEDQVKAIEGSSIDIEKKTTNIQKIAEFIEDKAKAIEKKAEKLNEENLKKIDDSVKKIYDKNNKEFNIIKFDLNIIFKYISEGIDLHPYNRRESFVLVPDYRFVYDLYKAAIARYEFAASYLGKGDIVLDISCGYGYGSSYILKNTQVKKVIGADNFRPAVEYANKIFKENESIEFVHVDIMDESSFEEASFDKIISIETIEHVKDDRSAANNLFKWLKKDGLLVCTVPNQNVYPLNIENEPYHHKHYTVDEITGLLEKVGLKVLEVYFESEGEEEITFTKEEEKMRIIIICKK